MSRFGQFFGLIRTKQWVKNGFLFLPLFFDLRLDNWPCLLQTLLAFVAFSMFASSIYIINDYRDIPKDRLHPTKRNRPLASGAISKPRALLIMAGLLTLGLFICWFLPLQFLWIVLAYVLLNVFYSFGLKNIPILDVALVSAGFVLRVFAGAAVCSIPVSVWIVTLTYLLALFIALAKRRDDVLLYNQSGQKMRKAVEGYNLEFLNTAISIMAGVIIVAYLMYTISETVVQRLGAEGLYFSTLFVILGLLRYLQITMVEENSGSPTDLLYRDPFLQITVLGWVGYNTLVIYW